MANISGFADLNNPNRGRRSPGMVPLNIAGGNQPMNIPFLGGGANQGDPRKATVSEVVQEVFCPTLHAKSFTSSIVIANITIFFITLIWGGLQIPSNEFLTPNPATLNTFGNRNPELIKNSFQIWRLLTPVFLHASLLHLLFNCLSTLVIGSQIEKITGLVNVAIIYFASGIGGNLYGTWTSDSLAVGASTAINGLLGCFIAYIIVNWNRIDPNTKCMMICMISFVVIMNLLLGLGGGSKNQSQADHAGHFGGLISGVIVGMALVKPNGGHSDRYEDKVKLYGQILTIAYFVLLTIFIYV